VAKWAGKEFPTEGDGNLLPVAGWKEKILPGAMMIYK